MKNGLMCVIVLFITMLSMSCNTHNNLDIIKPPKGRIAVIADGNSPDPDDIGGTAVTLALLRATALENRLVHYSHCCDLVKNQPNITHEEEKMRHPMMQTSCDTTALLWGGFEHIKFWDCVYQKDEAINDLTAAINASTEESPLWIIEAGEPDVIYFALEKADSTVFKHLYIVTHHKANDDSGDFVTWEQLLSTFPIKEVRIPDQNIKLQVPIADWDWAKNHTDQRINWLWKQGNIAEQDGVVEFQDGKFDCSDAGMIVYWITGAMDGGYELGTVDDCKTILLNYIDQN